MNNLIWEGLGQALIFLLLFRITQFIYNEAKSYDISKLINRTKLIFFIQIIGGLIAVFFISLMISGFINYGEINISHVATCFTVIVITIGYGLIKNPKELKHHE